MNEALSNALDVMQARVDESIEALIERGSSISTDSGLVHLPQAIRELPTSDTSISFHQDDTEAYKKAVPRGAQTYSNLISVGGKTRKVSTNLFEDASKGGIKWNVRVNQQEEYFSQLLPAGSYRLDVDAESNVEDDCVNWWHGVMLNDSGTSYEGESIENGFFTITEPKYIVPWVGATESGTPTSITVTQKGGTNEGTVETGETKTISIGSGSFCDISIETNTRVKVTVSDQFETYNGSEEFITEATEFIVGKGSYTYEWRNTSDSNTSVTIKVERYSYADIAVTLYPMVYAVPDASDEHILPNYVPYFENLAPTAVTEIASRAANLFDDVAFLKSHGFTLQSNGYWKGTDTAPEVIFTNIENRTGAISVSYSGKCDKSGTNNYSPITFAIRYVGESGSKYLGQLPVNGTYRTVTFTTDATKTVEKISYSYSEHGEYEIKDIMINWGASPLPYRPCWSDSVAIQDEVKNDASWGHSYKEFVNTYNFTEKAYTKAVNFIELDGVTAGKKFDGTMMVEKVRRMSISSLPKIMNLGTNNESIDFDITYFTPKAQYAVGKAHFYTTYFICCIPPEYDTVTKGNAWLAEMKANGTPIRLVYPLAEPIVTDFDPGEPKPFLFKTEAEGEIVFENTDKEAVPSSVKYLIDIGEAQL